MTGALGLERAHAGAVLFAAVTVVCAGVLVGVGVTLLLTGRDADTPGAGREDLARSG